MSKLSQYYNQIKLKELQRFFGEDIKFVKDTIVHFTHVIDNDNFIIVTSNLKEIKGNFVLMVGKNKAVYLKDWNATPIKNWNLGVDTFAVKLSRKYFKVYEFKSNFEEFSGDDETFDSLLEIARQQENDTTTWKLGHYGF